MQILLDRLLQLSGIATTYSTSRSNMCAPDPSHLAVITAADNLPARHVQFRTQAAIAAAAAAAARPAVDAVLPVGAVTTRSIKAGSTSPSSSHHQLRRLPTPAAAPAAARALHGAAAEAVAAGSRQGNGDEQADDARYAAAALHCLTQLRRALTDRVVEMFEQEYEELWLDVVCRRPPWDDMAFLQVLNKHWRSTLQVRIEHASARPSSTGRWAFGMSSWRWFGYQLQAVCYLLGAQR
jgi:hypothetical protein